MLSDDFKFARLAKRKGPSRKGANPKSTMKEIVGDHGHKPAGPSILWPALYRHLRKKGYSKAKAAAISNSAWKKKRVGLATNTPTSARGLAKNDPEQVEFSAEAEISKVDTEKQIVFGWAYQCIDENGEQVIDKSGEFVDDPEELENTAYDFVLNSRQGGVDHARTDDDEAPIVKSTLVESMMFTDDKKTAMGLPDSFPTGWWVGFKVHDDDTWTAVKKGHYKAFSVHGRGIRKEVED